MKINLKLLKKWGACSAGYSWFKRKYGNKSIEDVTVLDDLAYCRANWSIGSQNAHWLVAHIHRHCKKNEDYFFLFKKIGSPTILYFNSGTITLKLSWFDVTFILSPYWKFKSMYPTVTKVQLLKWFAELD